MILVQCPKCNTFLQLSTLPAKGQELACSTCKHEFVMGDDQEKPTAPRTVAPAEARPKPKTKPRDDNEPPRRRDSRADREEERRDSGEESPRARRSSRGRDDDNHQDAPLSRRSRNERDRDDDDDQPRSRDPRSSRRRDDDSRTRAKKGMHPMVFVGGGVFATLAIGGLIWALTAKKDERQKQPVNNQPTNTQVASNTPANNSPVNNTPVNNTPVNNTPVNNTRVNNTPVRFTPDNTPSNNTPANNNTPVNNTPPTDTTPKNTPPKTTPNTNPTPPTTTPVDPTPPTKPEPVDTAPKNETPVKTPPRDLGTVAKGELTREIEEKTKKATTLIRVSCGEFGGSGSGFIVRSGGDNAYVITNFHVVIGPLVQELIAEEKKKAQAAKNRPPQNVNPGFPPPPPGIPNPGFPNPGFRGGNIGMHRPPGFPNMRHGIGGMPNMGIAGIPQPPNMGIAGIPRPPGIGIIGMQPPGFGLPGMQNPGFGIQGLPGFPGIVNNPPPQAPKQEEAPKFNMRISVIINSGTPAEESIKAEVVAVDDDADLAALRIIGARNDLPAAIDLSKEAPLAETMPVYIFGYPGGVQSVVIKKGSVSQIRKDKFDEVADLQINGEIIPGNSGGPIVDAKGRLVGIAVSTVEGKNVGFAIPTALLNHLIDGSAKRSFVGRLGQVGNTVNLTGEGWEFDTASAVREAEVIQAALGQAKGKLPDEYVVLARLSDPLHRVKSATMLYSRIAPGTSFKPQGRNWAALPNAQKISLKLGDQSAVGDFSPPGDIANDIYAFQLSIVRGDGQTIYTEPHPLRLTFPKNMRRVTIQIKAPPGELYRRRLDETLPKQIGGLNAKTQRSADGFQMEVEPVDDPVGFSKKITFGDVVSVNGMTIVVEIKKEKIEFPARKKEKPLDPNDALFFCSDLKGFGIKNGPWRVTTKGRVGKPGGLLITVNGEKFPNGIGMHPPDRNLAKIQYSLKGKGKRFLSEVALNDLNEHVFDKGYFSVHGDGKELWKSDWINAPGKIQDCDIDIRGVDVLELRTSTPGVGAGLHMCWLNPRVLVDKASAQDLLPKAPEPPKPINGWVYVSDLTETESKDGPWPVTKNGKLGDTNDRDILVNGNASPKGISMHPPGMGKAELMFNLDQKYTRLKGKVAMNDGANGIFGKMTFEIRVDDKQIWKSKPMQKAGDVEEFDIDISNAKSLTIQTVATTFSNGMHAVWLDPMLKVKE